MMNKKITIRPEEHKDYKSIISLILRSFQEGTDYSDLCMIDGVELSVEEYGIGFRKNSTLTEKVNEATDALIKDGTLAALAEKYGLSLQLIANQK